MKNITVSVPDDVYRAARITAAERGTSVSALVASQLAEIAGASGNARQQARDELINTLARVRRDNPGFSARDRLAREALYERGIR